jgi:cellulose synthase/poly-beta-1,6-N-acetylglucosamine synthase-like glycosyltransferase
MVFGGISNQHELMELFYTIFVVLAAWIGFQLAFPFLTVLASRIWGRERTGPSGPAVSDYACIITAYQSCALAKPLAESILMQTHERLTVYLVADDCPETDFDIDDPRFVVLRPESPLRLKVKSIRYAVDRFIRPHGYTVVFDADNLIHPRFLEVINGYVAAGYRCIQGQRTAKNLDSNFAAADSLGELYKNYIERYAPYLLGGSAVISGSGMATETSLYRAYLDSPDILEGQEKGKRMLQEDKILQNFLLRRNERIGYALGAICYDEKVSTGKAVETQRSRWLFSYFQNIPNALGILRRGVKGLHANQLFFGIVTLALPMFIQLGMAMFLIVAGYWVSPWISVALVVATAVFGFNVLWTLRLSNASAAVWRAVWSVPGFISRQMLSLLKMGNPDKHFRHSEHKNAVSVHDLLNKP